MPILFEHANNLASIVIDESTLSPEQKIGGLIVSALPPIDPIQNTLPVLKVDVEKELVWYEYIEVPPGPQPDPEPDPLEDLRKQMEFMASAVDFILMNM